MESTTIYTIIISLAIWSILFLFLREFLTWYWKINKIVDLLMKQNKYLKNICNQFSDNSLEIEDDTIISEDINKTGRKTWVEKYNDEVNKLKQKK